MKANLTDGQFASQPGAIWVSGPFGESYMDQFPGVGPSPKPFKMKAVLMDGVVYIPDPDYIWKVEKRNRNYAEYPMVKSRYQIPAGAIKLA